MIVFHFYSVVNLSHCFEDNSTQKDNLQKLCQGFEVNKLFNQQCVYSYLKQYNTRKGLNLSRKEDVTLKTGELKYFELWIAHVAILSTMEAATVTLNKVN